MPETGFELIFCGKKGAPYITHILMRRRLQNKKTDVFKPNTTNYNEAPSQQVAGYSDKINIRKKLTMFISYI